MRDWAWELPYPCPILNCSSKAIRRCGYCSVRNSEVDIPNTPAPTTTTSKAELSYISRYDLQNSKQTQLSFNQISNPEYRNASSSSEQSHQFLSPLNPPSDNVPSAISLIDLSKFHPIYKVPLMLLNEKLTNFVEAAQTPHETSEAVNIRKMEAFPVQFEKESVLSILNMVLPSRHLCFCNFSTLEKWRIADHHVNYLLSLDHAEEGGLSFLICMDYWSQSEINFSLHFVCRNKGSRVLERLTIDLCSNKLPTKQTKSQQRIDECGPCSDVNSSVYRQFDVKVHPQKIVEARGNSRTKVTEGAIPLQPKTMANDSSGKGDETSLFYKIADCAMIKNKNIRTETGFEYCQFVEIYWQIIDESKWAVLASCLHIDRASDMIIKANSIGQTSSFELIISVYDCQQIFLY